MPRLRTPLQVERYLAKAFEETHRIGERVFTSAVIDAVPSRQLDDLEPRLTRHGYDVRGIASLECVLASMRRTDERSADVHTRRAVVA